MRKFFRLFNRKKRRALEKEYERLDVEYRFLSDLDYMVIELINSTKDLELTKKLVEMDKKITHREHILVAEMRMIQKELRDLD